MSVGDILLEIAERELTLDLLSPCCCLVQSEHSTEPGRLLRVGLHINRLATSTLIYLNVG